MLQLVLQQMNSTSQIYEHCGSFHWLPIGFEFDVLTWYQRQVSRRFVALVTMCSCHRCTLLYLRSCHLIILPLEVLLGACAEDVRACLTLDQWPLPSQHMTLVSISTNWIDSLSQDGIMSLWSWGRKPSSIHIGWFQYEQKQNLKGLKFHDLQYSWSL